jgi:hypothetical protein
MNNYKNDILNLICNLVLSFKINKIEKKVSYRISRGRAPSLSNLFENGLAIFVENNTEDNIKIYVDTPFCFNEKNKNRKTTIYPDIALIKNNYLICLIEAKIDLGYYKLDWPDKKKRIISSLFEAQKLYLNNQEVLIKKLLCINIILSGRNHSERINHYHENVENPIILIKKENLHPNNDNLEIDEYLRDIQNPENISEWEKLYKLICSLNTA